MIKFFQAVISVAVGMAAALIAELILRELIAVFGAGAMTWYTCRVYFAGEAAAKRPPCPSR